MRAEQRADHPSLWRVAHGDRAFVRCEVVRLAATTPEELELEGRRWRWGIVGERRYQIYRRWADTARVRSCSSLDGLDRGALHRIARAVNWL